MKVDPALVQERVTAIRERLASSGRDIELVAVTKAFPVDAVRAAVAAGCSMVGENYAQEVAAKFSGPDAPDGASVHYIGRLQSNKVRLLVPYVAVWESVDRPSLLTELARRAPGATVLIQVNATGEEGKGGCHPDAAAALVDKARTLDLDVDGMMTVGPTSGEPVATSAAFGQVRRLVDSLGLKTCSMGMSGDIDLAIEHGTTRVRVGSAIFGSRS